MTDPAKVVRTFFEMMQARRWGDAGSFVASDARIRFTETGEVFDGTGFLAMNRAYPEGWTIDVVEVLCGGQRVAAQVRVDLPPEVFWCAGFYTVRDDVIVEGVEHWVTEGSADPPDWREPFHAS